MLLEIILFAGLAGSTVFVGGLLANYFNHHVKESPVKYEIIHTLMTFGAGIILAAVTLVLIPKGIKTLGVVELSVSFIIGALLFMALQVYFDKKESKTSTLFAMLLDFVPEAIAIGAVFAAEPKVAILLAAFIGLQNLPESFNAFRDLVQSGFSTTKTLVIFFFLSFVGVASALVGFYFLQNSPQLTAHLMVFASGGILYLLIQDIIPESKLEKNHLTALGAIVGFWVGILGKMFI